MVGIVVVVLAVAVVAVVALAAGRPDSFRVERSAQIKAAPEKVFGYVNDFHLWTQWSPWEKVDPELKRSYGGAASGTGTVYGWEGNKDVGSGRMEITESVPGTKITIKLDFFKPFEAHNTAEFTFTPNGDTTTVTWAMFGPSPFLSKLIGLVFSMDKMVGGMFAQGLANLKAVAEK